MIACLCGGVLGYIVGNERKIAGFIAGALAIVAMAVLAVAFSQPNYVDLLLTLVESLLAYNLFLLIGAALRPAEFASRAL